MKKMKGSERMDKDLKYYMNFEYPVTLTKTEFGDYVAEILDLPGCFSGGDTVGKALKMLEDAKKAWIEDELEDGNEIPLPDAKKQIL
jgi:antitoxin HicB